MPVAPEIEVIHVAPEHIRPNPWNPNRMNAFMYGKAMESIRDHGFIDPITVRDVGPGEYQIIDGEHRYKAGVDLGYALIPCINLGEVDEQDARKLTIILNELRGQASPGEMGILLKGLAELEPLDVLLEQLPYTEDMFRALAELPALPPLPDQKPDEQPEPEKRWVERLYRMPLAAATVLDDAITKAKQGEDIEDWQGLERVAADFMAG